MPPISTTCGRIYAHCYSIIRHFVVGQASHKLPVHFVDVSKCNYHNLATTIAATQTREERKHMIFLLVQFQHEIFCYNF